MIQGPYPIFCRGHSGGRLLCEAFIRNGIDMGIVHSERKDTEFFAAHHPPMRALILNAYRYLESDTTEKYTSQQLLKSYVQNFLDTEVDSTKKYFGWKLGISLFTMLMVLDAFPTAKVIHLIRDGRDVMLSRLEARFGNLADPINKLVVFGYTEVETFADQPLTPETIATYRNELEMLHWVTTVRYGLQGRVYSDRYFEVKYEDICRDPVSMFSEIFAFLEIPFLDSTKEWLQQSAYTSRIAKWKTLSAEKLEKPLQIGGELLKELGYLHPLSIL